MYELKDSYFSIFDTSALIIVGGVIVLAITGHFFFKAKKEVITINEFSIIVRDCGRSQL